MAYTEIKTNSYSSRLWNSLKWVLFGFLLIFWSVYLLWWNEWRTIDVTQWLNQWQKITVEGATSPVDSNLEWKLVYINGKASTNEVLKDDSFLIKQNAIKLHRVVEMYQWEEREETQRHDNIWWSETVTTTYTYHKTWDDEKINSSHFKESGHNNPTNWKFESRSTVAWDVKVWDMKLSNNFISQINRSQPISMESKIFELFKKKK